MAESSNGVLGNTGKIEAGLAGHAPPPCGLVLATDRYESLCVIRDAISEDCDLTPVLWVSERNKQFDHQA